MSSDVREATTDRGLVGVTVEVVDGSCEGDGCGPGNPTTQTFDESTMIPGYYQFYYDANDPGEDHQWITPNSGKESVELSFYLDVLPYQESVSQSKLCCCRAAVAEILGPACVFMQC